MAMEAPGIYWLCPHEVLEKAGLAVVVVNGKHVKNLPGRKTNMKDCQWPANSSRLSPQESGELGKLWSPSDRKCALV